MNMDNKDFFDIENQIENAIDSAFKYIDKVNKTATDVRNNVMNSINYAAEDTINDMKTKFKETSDGIDKVFQNMSKKFEDGLNRGMNKLNKKDLKEQYRYIAKNPAGKYKGTFYSLFGIIGCVGFALSFIVCSFLAMLNIIFLSAFFKMILIVFFIFFLCCAYLTFKGSKIKRRIERFNKYSEILRGKNYTEIKTLGEAVSKKNKYVIKDLENMMNLEMFKEGHISNDKSYFMLGNELYKEYLNSLNSYHEREKAESIHENTSQDSPKTELNSVIENGEKYIAKIDSINCSLRGNDIYPKITEMSTITKNIIDTIRKNPNKLPLVKKFFNHYLPISLKLINSYKELNNQTIEGENIKKAKIEIEKSIDLINTAFKKLLDNLFEDVVLDVSSDISVLETLFTQEGLTENEFKNKR